MFKTLKDVWRGFWTEFRYSYRGHQEGGRRSEMAMRREEELGKRLDEEIDRLAATSESERIGRILGQAKTPEEKDAAANEIIRHLSKFDRS